jgi:PEGA domain
MGKSASTISVLKGENMGGKKILFAIILLAAAAYAQGCASIMHGSEQQVTVSSRPIGADVVVDDGLRTKTPAVLTLSRKSSHMLEISYEGYQKETVEIKRVVSGAAFGNLLFGGLIGAAVDTSTGAAYKLEPTEVSVDLKPIPPAAESAAPAVIDAKQPQRETPPQ